MVKSLTLLDILAQRHDEWIKMCISFDTKKVSLEDANDLVQDMYLRLNKYVETPDRIMYDDNEINTMFIYTTLRRLYINEYNYRKRFDIKKVIVDDDISEINYEYEEAKIVLQDKIKEEISSWHHYDSKIFNLIRSGIPMRKLSRDTDISLYSIFNTFSASKQKIYIKFIDEFNKLKNK